MGNNYQNLFETWERLAKHEVDHIWGFDTETRKQIGDGADIESWLAQPINQAVFQGYIQRCIEERCWAWRIETGFIQNNRTWTAGVTPGGAFGNDREVVAEYEKPACLALLTAYLSALAAQRSPNPGAWQHFKGDVVEVVGVASWFKDEGFAPYYNFKLEEDPNTKIAFGYDEYYALKDYGNRVFYSHASEQWARKTEVFLGLVGAEHPEHQGKLRFTEVPNAKA